MGGMNEARLSEFGEAWNAHDLETRPAGARHQLSDYINAATRAGLGIDHMSEHVVDEALVARSPRARKHLGWPLLLVMRLRVLGRVQDQPECKEAEP